MVPGDDEQGSESEASARSPRLLLVEDEDALRLAYERVLRKAGFDVTSVGDGVAALRELESSFDVIASDIGLPGLSGLDLLRRVRAKDLDVPVILMTGAPSVESAAAAVEEGIFRYLSKPVPPDKLLEAVRRALATGRMAAMKREAMRISGEGYAEGTGDRAGLQARFQSALDQLWMAFQPIVSLRAGKVFGYEALLRTGEPTLANPLHFLDAARRLGLTHTLGRAVRAKVAEAAASAPADVGLFVNAQPEELDDFELYSSTSPLSAYAARVVIEVTERQALDSIAGLRPRIEKLRRLGYFLAVDDLGAGYAGLSSFSILEPEFVKLDASLVRGVDGSRRKQSVIQSMLSLCERDLAIRVICEGVETVAERDALAALGCDLLQGYVFARPSKGFAPARAGEPTNL